jgi:hypothetical protein
MIAIMKFKINTVSLVQVAQAYNPSYSGSRDQEECGLMLAWANIFKTLSRKTPHTYKEKKIELVDWLKVKALSSRHSTAKKKLIMCLINYCFHDLFHLIFLTNLY